MNLYSDTMMVKNESVFRNLGWLRMNLYSHTKMDLDDVHSDTKMVQNKYVFKHLHTG